MNTWLLINYEINKIWSIKTWLIYYEITKNEVVELNCLHVSTRNLIAKDLEDMVPVSDASRLGSFESSDFVDFQKWNEI